MHYCPHCSHVLLKPVKVCPYCKKTVDYEILASVYQDRDRSEKDRTKLRKIWLKEHEGIFMLIGGVLLGFILGIIIISGYIKIQFENEREEYIKKMAEMELIINKRNAEAGDAISNYQKQLLEKSEIIKVLMEQKAALASVIRVTRSLAENSTVTPNSPEITTDYQNNMRNFRYQFYTLEEKLKEMTKEEGSSYNLNTLPQLVEE
jgi:hypothetical protein